MEKLHHHIVLGAFFNTSFSRKIFFFKLKKKLKYIIDMNPRPSTSEPTLVCELFKDRHSLTYLHIY